MSYKRMAAAIGAAFLVSQILAIAVHGFLLARDYQPYYGTLLRSQQEASWQMLLLPVSHLAFVSALVWMYGRLELEGPAVLRGLKLGLAGWVVGQIPLWRLWYAEQPWPGTLVVKQLTLEFVSTLIIGMSIAIVARPQPRAAS